MEKDKNRDGGNRLSRKVDSTLYRISVMLSENAEESAEEILARMIADELSSEKEDDEDG
jgi:hypothetical protein